MLLTKQLGVARAGVPQLKAEVGWPCRPSFRRYTALLPLYFLKESIQLAFPDSSKYS